MQDSRDLAQEWLGKLVCLRATTKTHNTLHKNKQNHHQTDLTAFLDETPSGTALRLNHDLKNSDNKSIGFLPALTACDVSKDSSTSPPETLVPTPIVRTPNLLEATDIEMLALNEIVDPLRPNPDCASAETELTRREERKKI